MTRLRRTLAATLSLSMASCALMPSGPLPGTPPQQLRVTTYLGTDIIGPLGQPGPGQGWGRRGSESPRELPGAQCTAGNDRGSWTLVTPGAMQVERSAARLRITCRLEGYREARVELPCISPRTEGAAGGAYAAMRFAAFSGPGAVILVPAGAIVGAIAGAMALGAAAGSLAAEGMPQPDVCAYGAGRDVQVYLHPVS